MCRLLLIALLLFSATNLFATTTTAERVANEAAQHELDTSPPHGNLPSYSLAPQALAKGVHLEQVRHIRYYSQEVWGIVQLILLLSFGVIRRFQNWVGRSFRNRWLQGYGFLLLFLLATTLLNLPLDAYAQWLRRSYSLSVQGWGSWTWDQVKSLLLSWSLGGSLVMLLFLFIKKLPRTWWFGFWIASVPILVIGLFFTPYVVDPLFGKFEPLAKSQPKLVQQLEQVVQRGHMDIPPERMFLKKASEKTTELNAYVTGFGASKRVVVWDTSIAKGTPDEILFIFGHESGHYVLGHIVRGLLLSAILLLPLLYAAYLFIQWCLVRFGASWGIHTQMDWGTLVVLSLAFMLFTTVLEPVMAGDQRAHEHDADVYGQEAIHGIVSNPAASARAAFQVLAENSYEVPNPSRFVEFWTYTHPATGRRAAFAAHYDPWASGMQPKYFK